MEPSSIVKHELVARAQDGDDLAAQEILTRIRSPLSGFIHHMMGPKPIDQVEDILQDVLLKALRAIPTFDQERGVKFSTWVFTIARNHCIDLIKKQRLQFQRIGSHEAETPIVDESTIAPPRAAEIKEFLERLSAAISLISPPQRDVFEMHIRGMRKPQIAHRLGIAVGTVKSRLHRARAALRRELGELAPEPVTEPKFA